MKDMDIRAKEKIASTIRFKSYGKITVKGMADDQDGEMRVLGYFTDDTVDELGDIITKEATEKAVEKWRKWGNIRTMHQYPSGRVERVGSGDGLAWNEIETVPIDEQTQKLIDGGVLQAYSVGIIPREYELNQEALEGHEDDWWFFPLIIHDYDMIEISYVDHPAHYNATINDVSIGKGREAFAHRAVLYKNSELIGDVDMDKVKEKALKEAEEKALEQEQPVPEPEPEVKKELEPTPEPEAEEEKEMPGAGLGEQEPEEQVDEKDINDGEEEAVEKDAETDSEFDVELAVRELSEQITELKDFVHGEFAADIISKVLEALDYADEAEVEGEPDTEATEEPSDDTEEGIEKQASRIEEIIEEVVERQLEKFTDDIIEAVSFSGRKAKVAASDSDEERGEDVDAATKYLDMDITERRKQMVDMLEEMYPFGTQ